MKFHKSFIVENENRVFDEVHKSLGNLKIIVTDKDKKKALQKVLKAWGEFRHLMYNKEN